MTARIQSSESDPAYVAGGATDAELAAHVNDADDAHRATAIYSEYYEDNVEGAMQAINGGVGAVQTALNAHTGGTDVHEIEAIFGLQAALAASQPLDSDLTAIAALTTTSYGRSFLAAADAAAARTLTGAETAGAAAAAQAASQPLDSDLTAIAALTTTAFGRALLEKADAAATRTALGLDVEAWHSVGGAGEPAFTNSWANFGSGYEALRFYKHDSIVRIQGAISRGAGASTLSPFTLPAGYRPSGHLQMSAYTQAINITDAGVVTPVANSSFLGFAHSFRV